VIFSINVFSSLRLHLLSEKNKLSFPHLLCVQFLFTLVFLQELCKKQDNTFFSKHSVAYFPSRVGLKYSLIADSMLSLSYKMETFTNITQAKMFSDTFSLQLMCWENDAIFYSTTLTLRPKIRCFYVVLISWIFVTCGHNRPISPPVNPGWCPAWDYFHQLWVLWVYFSQAVLRADTRNTTRAIYWTLCISTSCRTWS